MKTKINENKNKVGRPIEKEGRTKIGLSLNGSSVDKLSELSAMTGKSKSRIIEEAISMFNEREIIIQARIKKIEKLGDKGLLDLDLIIEDRLKKEQEESSNMEVRNVG